MLLSATPLKMILERSAFTAGDEATLAGNMISPSDSLFKVTVPLLLINYLESRQGDPIAILGSLQSRLEAGRAQSLSSRADDHFAVIACPRSITTVLRLSGNDVGVVLSSSNFVIAADKSATGVTVRGLPATVASASLEGRLLSEIIELDFLPHELKVISSNADGANQTRLVCQGVSVELDLLRRKHSVSGSDDTLSVAKRIF